MYCSRLCGRSRVQDREALMRKGYEEMREIDRLLAEESL